MTSTGFDQSRAESYDVRIQKMIPGYDVLHRLTDVFLSAELPTDASILTVGAGTGTELTQLGTSHAGWHFTAVEPAPAMAKLGREKFATHPLGNRIHWHGGPLKTLPPGDPFDAATLILVLHFLPDNGDKEELLTEIAGRLKPGAPLFLASYFGAKETTRTKKFFDLTKAWALANGVDAKEVAEKLDPERPDMHLVPEDRLKALLRYAGFIDVQRIYQGLLIGGWVARTPR